MCLNPNNNKLERETVLCVHILTAWCVGIFSALKMFGKKFSSKRLLVSSKVWMHTIPTEDCDILLTLPATISDTTIMWLLSRLHSRTPQISVYFRHHSNSGIYGLYMTTSYEK